MITTTNEIIHAKKRRRYRSAVARFFGNMLLSLLAILGLIALCLILVVGYYVTQNMSADLDESILEQQEYVGPSQLYYYRFDHRAERIGERIKLDGGELDGGSRCIPVRYEQIPKQLVDAFVSIEDKRFWKHHGIDWLRSAQAGINYLTHRKNRFGASTITQQLVKNLTGEDDISIRRKVQEIFRANALENCRSKSEIMESYLNIINLARGNYGVGAAAACYFDKEIDQLTLSECATLAAITNNPTYYDPVRFPEHTKERRNVILHCMAEQGYITQDMALAAAEEPLQVLSRSRDHLDDVRSWYVDLVVQDVIDDLCQQLGYSKERANRLIWSGGLTIDIAMQPEMQSLVEKYYQDLSHFPVHANGERAQSAIFVMDAQTGDILAVAGSVGEKKGNRIRSYATDAKRPAASSLKPLSVYAPALEWGKITWASVFDDVPVRFTSRQLKRANGSASKITAWPQNANRVYRGLTDVRYAVAHSVNTVAVRVLQSIGTQRSFDFLKQDLHMDSLIEQKESADGRTLTDCGEAALALGQLNYGITLRELTAAYSMAANGGICVRPHSYYRVTDCNGKVLLSNTVQANVAISEQNACILTELLKNVVTQGTGRAAAIDGVEVAGKTGTSGADCDKWFIGYTPRVLAGVWYGFEYPESLSDVQGNPAVKIWHDTVSALHVLAGKESDRSDAFPLSPGVIRVSYCRDSGLLPTDACRADVRGDRCSVGYFAQGTEPQQRCTCHILKEWNTETQTLADGSEPPEQRRTVGLLRLAKSRSFPKRIYVADEKYCVNGS